ncbi:hypothetical protein DI392_12930 [Vibrio albus]|uniref:Uncharacterized protein n=2 Tax=Vibrio TaxID=662 RepID=A0A0C3HU13_9VIBR|nr:MULTISPECIES: hypothetical protein [Vibrio]MBY8081914.1 hypothetical protein [Vibrio fluvialis]HDY8061142.1 hypothetical protein [Vibrio vulnificus]KIN11661.1 hypothetical protein SU60_06195 [Vibrio mytili]MBA5916562.1 hypothetical protein [Vibrio parahaemolyticus]MBO1659323.1 hypothetical protein [Vibrio parahaemolyticus]
MDSELKQESQFYRDFEDKLLHVIAKAHVINLSCMSKGEAMRLVAHLENLNPEKYPEFYGVSKSLINVTSSNLIVTLNNTIQKMSSSLSARLALINPENTR